jgi:hypothetical protein
MENLIQHFKKQIELLRNDTIEKIQIPENKHDSEYFFILTGKMLAFGICLKEIEQLLKYHKETVKI